MAIQKKSIVGGSKTSKSKNASGSKVSRGQKVASTKALAGGKTISAKKSATLKASEVNFPYTNLEIKYGQQH